MLKQKLHNFCNRSSLDDGSNRAESTRDTYNYGQYINQFPPNTIKVIREFERVKKKICMHKMSIMFNEICIYIYIYIYICIMVRVFVNGPGGLVKSQVESNQTLKKTVKPSRIFQSYEVREYLILYLSSNSILSRSYHRLGSLPRLKIPVCLLIYL